MSCCLMCGNPHNREWSDAYIQTAQPCGFKVILGIENRYKKA